MSVSGSQLHGDVHVLTTCLTILQQLGPIESLDMVCHKLSRAEVQLLAGLRIRNLRLAIFTGCQLHALPATDTTVVQYVRNWFLAPDRVGLFLDVTWAAMTSARTSTSASTAPPWSRGTLRSPVWLLVSGCATRVALMPPWAACLGQPCRLVTMAGRL